MIIPRLQLLLPRLEGPAFSAENAAYKFVLGFDGGGSGRPSIWYGFTVPLAGEEEDELKKSNKILIGAPATLNLKLGLGTGDG